MKELFELVLKTLETSEKSDIFYTIHEEYKNFSPHSRAMISIDNKDIRFSDLAGISELNSIFKFYLKFEDGDPNVEVKLYEFKASKIKTKEFKTGRLWNRKTKINKIVLESYPIYNITAGELLYTTTVEESRQLHKVYDNLIKRDKDSKAFHQKQKIRDRLKGNVKLDLKTYKQ